jgi:hypothetical protein
MELFVPIMSFQLLYSLLIMGHGHRDRAGGKPSDDRVVTRYQFRNQKQVENLRTECDYACAFSSFRSSRQSRPAALS